MIEKNFDKSQPLLEDLMTVFKGQKDVSDLYYMYAECYYGNKDYLMSSHYFKNFQNLYPKNDKVETAAYLSAMSYYHLSNAITLDQKDTKLSVDEFQIFANKFPKSNYINDVNKHIDELRKKLEEKDFNNAFLYYKMGEYQSSILAFSHILDDFPETAHKEEIAFLTIKSHYLWAKNSVVNKQASRYNTSLSLCQVFNNTYPKSNYLSNVRKIKTAITKQLK